MKLFVENGYSSVNKAGEELCGDNVAISRNGDYTTMVLADGMGSGVKANILSILTSKILCTMVANEIGLEECIETVIQTLPVCKVRQVAYSTFSVVHVNSSGKGTLLEFDNPAAIYYHRGKCEDFDREKLVVSGKEVYRTDLNLERDDAVILMSDGTVHAGVGMLLNLGWQRSNIKEYMDREIKPYMSARAIACTLTKACNDLYMDSPGDDTTAAAVKLREELNVNVMVGPPLDRENAGKCVDRFMEGAGKKVVCGGTTSHIVAERLNRELVPSMEFPDKDIPPIASIEGIDLVTEGVLTLRRLNELAVRYLSVNDLSPKHTDKRDGASLLANILFEEATHVNFFVGQSVNAAHQGLPIDTTMKLKLVENVAAGLRKMGKSVSIFYD